MTMDLPLAVRDKKSLRWLIAIVSVVIVSSVVAWLMARSNPLTGTSVKVVAGPIEESIVISVEAVPVADRLITTATGGTIEELVATPGQEVAAGDVLLRLANPSIAGDLMDAESDFAIAEAEVATERGRLQEEIDGIRLELDRANLDLKVARAQVEAERKLQEAGISSRISLVRSQTEFEKQAMATRQAERKLAKARSTFDLRMKPSLAKLSALSGRVRAYRAARDELLVRAPFKGLYSGQDLKVGQTMPPGAIVAEVISKDSELRVSIPAGYGDLVRLGQIIRLNGGRSAVLTAIEPIVRDGMLGGRAQLQHGERSVANGTTYNANLVIASHGSGAFVEISRPKLANRTIEANVTDREGTTRRRSITFGAQYSDLLVVQKGAKRGDVIHGI